MSAARAGEAPSGIAVIGMSGRFPGAAELETFWRNLAAGVESIATFGAAEAEADGLDPATAADPRRVLRGGALDGADLFDAAFFGYSPREAELLDPQQRLFLEAAWSALEDAGCDPRRAGGRIGVFAGAGFGAYLVDHVLPHRELLAVVGPYQAAIANDKDFLATRVSYELDLRGPSISVQTACSTSLVAVCLACQSLATGDCDVALAGGVALRLPQRGGYLYLEDGILSPDGRCRAFDAAARGTVPGSGVGVVVLKRLDEALAGGDAVRAIVRGWAVNNDGGEKAGFTAPRPGGQAEVIAEALALAGVDPGTVGYVEAHGTGTRLGDPIEVAALRRAFADAPEGSCALGSVKTNVGHLDAAAGVAGMIKTVLALERGLIPPSLHCERPNPEIDFAGGPFRVATRLAAWPAGDHPRRAGVSSFGIGGTNAHVVLEEAPRISAAPTESDQLEAPRISAAPTESDQLEAPPMSPAPTEESDRLEPPGAPALLLLSARTATALDAATANLAAHLAGRPDLALADVAFTLQVGRRGFAHRRALVACDAGEAAALLRAEDPSRVWTAERAPGHRAVAFLFPGQGAQRPGMAAGIYRRYPVFRRELDRCAELLLPQLGLDLRPLLVAARSGGDVEAAAAGERLRATALAQPALFAVEYALARQWMAWGVEPAAMLGHSVGEWVAACLAEVFPVASALELVAARGRLLQALPPGAMLSLPLGEAEALRLLAEEPVEDGSPPLALAAVNAPAQVTVAGPEAAVERLAVRLAAAGIAGRRLHTSHAFHSAMVEPAVEPFRRLVERAGPRPPRLAFLSNATGGWITPELATDPAYWARHLRATVRFAPAVEELLAEPGRVLLEVGPGDGLAALARRQPAARGTAVVASLPGARDPRPPEEALLEAAGRLWLAGVEPDWEALHAGLPRRRARLPTYPFERRRYWLEPRRWPAAETVAAALAPAAAAEAAAPAALALHPRLAPGAYDPPQGEVETRVAALWQELLGVDRVGRADDFFALGGNSLSGLQILSRLRAELGVELALESFFEARTVAAMAQAVTAARREGEAEAEDGRLAALLAEVESLSDDEAAAFLAAEEGAATEAGAGPPAPPTPPTPLITAAGAAPTAPERHAAPRHASPAPIRLSLFFFSADGSTASSRKYGPLLSWARFADREGFAAVWTPERHFQEFGGLYPNPSVLGAALAVATDRLQIRAGSVALPLHNPVRVAEEWAVVDNLSGGRVAISCAAGWHPSDFVLRPEAFAERKEVMFRHLETIRRLWAGETLLLPGGDGREFPARLLPRPLQRELPVWITSSGSTPTWVRAGEVGANVLSAMGSQPLDDLERKIVLYRAARRSAGHAGEGVVTVMLHAFLGDDPDAVRETVREPLSDYLRTHQRQRDSFLEIPGISAADKEALIPLALDHYLTSASLIGTPKSCSAVLDRLAAAGVDEAACLVDFGVARAAVEESLERLAALGRRHAPPAAGEAGGAGAAVAPAAAAWAQEVAR